LIGGELLDGLPQRGDILRYLLHLRRVEEGGGGRFGLDVLWRSLRNGWRLPRIRHGRPNSSVFGTCQRLRPAKLLHPARDHLLGFGRPAKFWGACRD
jgi:hypothetical protein